MMILVKHIKVFLLLLLFSFCSAKLKSDVGDEKDAVLLECLRYLLDKGHYVQRDIDDDFSEKVYESYLETVDKNKRYLLREDIEKLEQYKFRLDDQFKNSSAAFFDMSL